LRLAAYEIPEPLFEIIVALSQPQHKACGTPEQFYGTSVLTIGFWTSAQPLPSAIHWSICLYMDRKGMRGKWG
jgi:hypothetical protein